MSNNENEKKEIEIIIGDNSCLEITDVENCANTLRPKKVTPKGNIVIPKEKSQKKSNDTSDNS